MEEFSAIIGQPQAVQILKNQITTGKISHAYLFLGPEGSGKMLTAQAFSRAVIRSSDGRADIFLAEGIHPDLLIIQKPESKTKIGKEQVTGTISPWLALKPYRASRRIVIINQAHYMSIEAANALLKILEEPPPYAILILVAENYNLLETIISRCQLIRFSSLREKDVEQFLINRGIEPNRALKIGQICQGNLALALRYAEGEAEISLETARLIIQQVASGNRAAVFNSVGLMEKEPVLITNLLQVILRDMVIYQRTGNQDHMVFLENLDLAKSIRMGDLDKAAQAINKVEELKRHYMTSVNPLLVSINVVYEIAEIFL
ncbi:MAG: ATP-binding protein [Syntrophomonadaceae bacterium]